MRELGKKEWEKIHGRNSTHNIKFKDLGWRWTPMICKHHSPHLLMTDSYTMNDRS